MFRPTYKLESHPSKSFPVDYGMIDYDTCTLAYVVFDKYVEFRSTVRHTNLFELYTTLIKLTPLRTARKHFKYMIPAIPVYGETSRGKLE